MVGNVSYPYRFIRGGQREEDAKGEPVLTGGGSIPVQAWREAYDVRAKAVVINPGQNKEAMSKSSELADAACALAEEIRDGKWDHISDLRWKPVPAIPEIIGELRRRAPGFTTAEYEQAISRGLFDSR